MHVCMSEFRMQQTGTNNSDALPMIIIFEFFHASNKNFTYVGTGYGKFMYTTLTYRLYWYINNLLVMNQPHACSDKKKLMK